jgi:hypothetical protein
MEATPNLGLPESIEAFDVGLEADFPRRGEDGNNAQTQAQADDLADDVWAVMRSLEAGVIVELGEGGQAVFLPKGAQALEGKSGGEAWGDPSGHLRAQEAFGGVGVNEAETFDGQILNAIEGVDLGALESDGGQMPARGGRWAADAGFGVEPTAAQQNARDGAHRRQRRIGEAKAEGLADGNWADEAKIAVQGQRSAQLADGQFEMGRSLKSLGFGSTTAVGEVGVEGGGTGGAREPVLNGAQGDAEGFGDGALGAALSAEFEDELPGSERDFFSLERMSHGKGGDAPEAGPWRLAALAATAPLPVRHNGA